MEKDNNHIKWGQFITVILAIVTITTTVTITVTNKLGAQADDARIMAATNYERNVGRIEQLSLQISSLQKISNDYMHAIDLRLTRIETLLKTNGREN